MTALCLLRKPVSPIDKEENNISLLTKKWTYNLKGRGLSNPLSFFLFILVCCCIFKFQPASTAPTRCLHNLRAFRHQVPTFSRHQATVMCPQAHNCSNKNVPCNKIIPVRLGWGSLLYSDSFSAGVCVSPEDGCPLFLLQPQWPYTLTRGCRWALENRTDPHSDYTAPRATEHSNTAGLSAGSPYCGLCCTVFRHFVCNLWTPA